MAEQSLDATLVKIYEKYKSQIDEFGYNPITDKNNLSKTLSYLKRTGDIFHSFLTEFDTEINELFQKHPDKIDVLLSLREDYIKSIIK
jgi:hypothetical protein